MATLPKNDAVVGLSLHTRMLADDPVVFDEIYMRYVASLERHLRGYIARKQLFLRAADLDDLVSDAITEAMIGYHRKPESFKPNLRSLGGYLQMSAMGDFLNLFSREVAAQSKVVEFGEEDWNILTDGRFDPVSQTESEEVMEALQSVAEFAAQTDEDRTVMDLLLQTERKTSVYAEALGIAHLSEKEQRAMVNKIKDRLTKRLRRAYRGGSADGTYGPGSQ